MERWSRFSGGVTQPFHKALRTVANETLTPHVIGANAGSSKV